MLNPLQSHHFEIQLDQLLLLSYNIRKSWIRSAYMYTSCTTSFDNLARGSEAHHILQNTAKKPLISACGSKPCKVNVNSTTNNNTHQYDHKARQTKINTGLKSFNNKYVVTLQS
jgi:hypothetical protein